MLAAIYLRMMTADAQLLENYVREKSQDAFTELVRRHLNLVYSAALRQVRSPQLAEEVSQSVFVDLAGAVGQLKPDTILTAWLYQVTRRTAIDVVRRESRRQARERLAVEMAAMNTAADWTHIEPLLDDAMEALDETDRAAILLRYFENKSLREVGESLGTSDDAAQKRVSRAVERLREFFSKRGVAIGAGGLVVLVSANAVQAAPVALATTISAGALLTGSAFASTALTATKVIAMTTMQKILITATVAILAGAGIYEAHQASQLREQNTALEQRQAPLAAQLQQSQSERDEATNRLAAMGAEIARFKSAQNQTELLKLRGQVGSLQQQLVATESKTSAPATGISKMMSDPKMKEFIHQAQLNLIKSRYGDLFQELKLTPEQTEKFVQLMGDSMLKNTEKVSDLPPETVHEQEVAQTMAGGKTELENQLQSLLGETDYARFKEFTDEIPARATVSLLNTQLGGASLSDEQRAQLFQIVKAEPFDLTHGLSGDLDKAFFGSQEDVDNYLLKVTESNQRIVQQAGSFLTPDQLTALNTVLTNGVTARITQAAALVQKH